jgi:hypothetical protein
VRRAGVRTIVLAAGGVALVGALAAALLVVLALDRGGSEGAPAPPEDGLTAIASLEPRIVLFGDTVTARVDVALDRSAIDADAVRVAWAPAPWRHVRPPERTVETDGQVAHIRTTYLLSCLTRECAPARETEEIAFPAARVSYPEGGSAGPTRVEAEWPSLLVHSRLGGLDADRRDALAAPWRADFVSLPAVTYRMSPGALIAVLVGLAALLFGIAAVVTYRAWPRPVPEPEPEPPPPPVASALEQALALLESPVAMNGNEGRRRALELVADEVERVGDLELALAARALAWSPDAPEVPATRALATRLRDRLELNGAPA